MKDELWEENKRRQCSTCGYHARGSIIQALIAHGLLDETEYARKAGLRNGWHPRGERAPRLIQVTQVSNTSKDNGKEPKSESEQDV